MMPTTEEYQKAKKVVAEYEKASVKSFYKQELKWSEGDELHEMYDYFISFLFGHNQFGLPLERVLGIKGQVTFKQFKALFSLSKSKGRKLSDLLLSMENDDKYTKGKKSLYMTLHNWLSRTFQKKY
jgi:hypothetical protein